MHFFLIVFIRSSLHKLVNDYFLLRVIHLCINPGYNHCANDICCLVPSSTYFITDLSSAHSINSTTFEYLFANSNIYNLTTNTAKNQPCAGSRVLCSQCSKRISCNAYTHMCGIHKRYLPTAFPIKEINKHRKQDRCISIYTLPEQVEDLYVRRSPSSTWRYLQSIYLGGYVCVCVYF